MVSSSPQRALANLVSGRELAEVVSEPYTTIDHWSDQRLLRFVKRGNRRLYEPELNQSICERIRELQQEGMSLATMRTVLLEELP